MKQRKWLLVLLLIPVAAVLFYIWQDHHAPIDEWSSTLTAENIEIAQLSKGYGVEEISYDIPAEELNELISLLKTSVTEKNSSRDRRFAGSNNDCRLYLYSVEKDWVFHCLDNGKVSLMFNDPETSDYFGCQDNGGLLYLDSPELWSFIMDSIQQKAS